MTLKDTKIIGIINKDQKIMLQVDDKNNIIRMTGIIKGNTKK